MTCSWPSIRLHTTRADPAPSTSSLASMSANTGADGPKAATRRHGRDRGGVEKSDSRRSWTGGGCSIQNFGGSKVRAMGMRGKGASAPKRAPRIDRRPHSSIRGFRMDGPEGWDLILGDGRHWSDPLDPERRATWRDHRDAIITRWVKPFRPGWRPAAWFDFDLPELAKRASPWRACPPAA